MCFMRIMAAGTFICCACIIVFYLVPEMLVDFREADVIEAAGCVEAAEEMRETAVGLYGASIGVIGLIGLVGLGFCLADD